MNAGKLPIESGVEKTLGTLMMSPSLEYVLDLNEQISTATGL
jgi:hypothetical protein